MISALTPPAPGAILISAGTGKRPYVTEPGNGAFCFGAFQVLEHFTSCEAR